MDDEHARPTRLEVGPDTYVGFYHEVQEQIAATIGARVADLLGLYALPATDLKESECAWTYPDGRREIKTWSKEPVSRD